MARGEMRGTRGPLEPLNNLKNWPITGALQSWLDRIGFGFLSKLNQYQSQIKIDRKLVDYIVSSYNEDSHCFEFNGIQFYFSLIDVYMLTGLPITGEPVLGHTDGPTNLFNEAFPSFRVGNNKDKEIFSKAKIKTSWLRDKFSSLQVNEGDPLWDEYRRAFMLWCITSYIVPDASSGVVEIEYTTMLRDLENVGKYAWGAAAWATMQHQLKSRNLNGMTYALLLFMVLRIEPLHDLFLGSSGEEPIVEQFPLIFSYLTRLTNVCNRLCCLKSRPYNFRETLQPSQVKSNPYESFLLRCKDHPFSLKDHPFSLKDQLSKACSKTLCFNRVVVELHEPNRVPEQFGFVKVVEHDFSDLQDIKKQIPKKGPKKYLNLSIRYACFTKFWYSRSPLRGQLLNGWTVQPWMEGYQALVESAGGEGGGARVEEPIGGGAFVEEEMVEVEAPISNLSKITGPSRAIVTRRKLLVLDIDGVLAEIVEGLPDDNSDYIPYVPYSYTDTPAAWEAVFKRPHCEDFVKFCLERFDVGIWSAKKKENVISCIGHLLSYSTRCELKFCLDQSWCTPSRRNDHVMYKETTKLRDFKYEDVSNILLVDDSRHKASLNLPHTAIFPMTYEHNNLNDNSLGPNGERSRVCQQPSIS